MALKFKWSDCMSEVRKQAENTRSYGREINKIIAHDSSDILIDDINTARGFVQFPKYISLRFKFGETFDQSIRVFLISCQNVIFLQYFIQTVGTFPFARDTCFGVVYRAEKKNFSFVELRVKLLL